LARTVQAQISARFRPHLRASDKSGYWSPSPAPPCCSRCRWVSCLTARTQDDKAGPHSSPSYRHLTLGNACRGLRCCGDEQIETTLGGDAGEHPVVVSATDLRVGPVQSHPTRSRRLFCRDRRLHAVTIRLTRYRLAQECSVAGQLSATLLNKNFQFG
jgi:hypothetical protein